MTIANTIVAGLMVATGAGGVTGWISMNNSITSVSTKQEQQQEQNTERYENLREDIIKNRELLQKLLLQGQK